MDPVTCTVDFRDEGAAAALGVLGQREDGTIADVRVLRATTIPGCHGPQARVVQFGASPRPGKRGHVGGHGHHGSGRQHGRHGRICNAHSERGLRGLRDQEGYADGQGAQARRLGTN
jgi:hypothetical protein